MKKISVLLIILIGTISSFGQIKGDFIPVNFKNNVFIVFKGKNISGQNIHSLYITCINEIKKEKRFITINSLAPNEEFTIGPQKGWIWKKDEKIIIKYNQNNLIQLICPRNSMLNRPFKKATSRIDTFHGSKLYQLFIKRAKSERNLAIFKRAYIKNKTIKNWKLIKIEEEKINKYNLLIKFHEKKLSE